MGNEEKQFASKLLACEQALCQFGERVKKILLATFFTLSQNRKLVHRLAS